jgi:hypothetical protein
MGEANCACSLLEQLSYRDAEGLGQIRYFDSQTAGVSPSAFIDAIGPTVAIDKGLFRLPDEAARDATQVLKLNRK